MVEPAIGVRIAQWRRRRGLSQVALAGLVGRSESWLSQVERGLRGVDSLVVLRELARVLRVDLDDLAPHSSPSQRGANEPAAAALERALLAPGPAVLTTAGRVAAAHAAYQGARYGEVLTELPELIAQLSATDDPWVLAAGWVLVAKMLTKIGTFDLALLAADRARESARRTGDGADVGMAVYQVVCALLPTPRAPIGEQLAVDTAVDLDTADAGRGGGGEAVGSVAGALWLIAAIAAARRGDAHTAQERLEQAQRLAEWAGRDANLRWTAFGPTNVALYRVSVAAELGDATAALAAASGLEARRFPPALHGRRVQVGLDLAWAYACRRQDADAILALLDVERAAPDVTRHNVYARSTISTLLARGTAGAHVRTLAARSDVAS